MARASEALCSREQPVDPHLSEMRTDQIPSIPQQASTAASAPVVNLMLGDAADSLIRVLLSPLRNCEPCGPPPAHHHVHSPIACWNLLHSEGQTEFEGQVDASQAQRICWRSATRHRQLINLRHYRDDTHPELNNERARRIEHGHVFHSSSSKHCADRILRGVYAAVCLWTTTFPSSPRHAIISTINTMRASSAILPDRPGVERKQARVLQIASDLKQRETPT